MARQVYKVAPYMKHLEVFNDFSGGLNTVDTNDKLANNELTSIKNMDLSERGSLKRRKGMIFHSKANPNAINNNSWASFGAKKWSELG